MPKFSLAPYSIRVKERRTDKYIPLSAIPGCSATANVDLLETMHHYFDVILSSLPHNPDEEEVLRVDFVKKNLRGICGRLKSG